MIDLSVISTEIVGTHDPVAEASELGFHWTTGDQLLTFATSHEFLSHAVANPRVTAILVDESIEEVSVEALRPIDMITVRNAKLNFFRVHNSLRNSISYPPTRIHPTSRIHPSAFIDAAGVLIGEDVVVEPFVNILQGTSIENGAIIRAGAVIGGDALDIRKDENGNPYMTDHLGGVHIGVEVEVGHHSVIDRAIFRQTRTEVGNYTKIGCQSNISHGVQVGERNILAAGVKICGSTSIGSDNWFGPSSTVSNLLTIGSRNHIALGATLFSSIDSDTKVIGTRIISDRRLF
jgi:UDP-3-O-[3-hydroxymyristoyl] glucosamine N-acyltransferase